MTALSKSTYLAGCQCPRRLWLRSFAPEFASESDGADWAAAGSEIGRCAHALFPGGVLVVGASLDDAVARTRELLADPSVPAIFEGAFVHAGVGVRVDVLERLPGGAWGLREVKSGLRVRDIHLHDAGLQRLVVGGNGLPVPSVEIVHLDRSYVRGEGGVDWARLFTRTDVSTEVACLLSAVRARVEALHRVLACADAPNVEPDEHCFSPHACEFWAHCTREKPVDWVHRLPGWPKPVAELRAAGIERIVDIPDDFPLSPVQARARDAVRSGRAFVGDDLGAALAALGPPTAYLDFETISPAVPIYPGTRPYERIPFQWSLHELDATGGLTHRELLTDGRHDPRREFAERLLEALGGEARPVLVYSSYEDGVLAELASAFPDLVPGIDALRARLVDLLPIVRQGIYHPAFGGSFSLKAVAPALVEGFGYGDLDAIAGGGAASAAFLRIASGAVTNPAEETRLRGALRVYCERDTLALVELHQALRTRAAD